MRLIDEDKVLEHLEKVKKESASLVDIAHIIGFQSVIDAQPTAFDPDKVVEQLEEEKMRYFLTTANTGDKKSDAAYEAAANAIDKAIEIVKGGGVNDNTD